jgi:DASS family divalent anion:Na+ symporter
MYPAFLGLSLALGTPPMLAVFILIFFSNLFGGLTHYSLAPAPLLFGVGYVDIKSWWKIGFLTSVINILIWSTIGVAWWKFLGYW